jgi:hypothetical protein
MGMLSLLSVVAGVFMGGLVVVAAIVAGWELLRQREQLDQIRRDRALYKASSPLPLTGAALAKEAWAASATAGPAAAPMMRRDLKWIETRPMILSPAADDETRIGKPERELDLQLE